MNSFEKDFPKLVLIVQAKYPKVSAEEVISQAYCDSGAKTYDRDIFLLQCHKAYYKLRQPISLAINDNGIYSTQKVSSVHLYRCYKCNVEGDESMFYLRNQNGYISAYAYCKECNNKISLEWQKKNRTKVNGYQRQRRENQVATLEDGYIKKLLNKKYKWADITLQMVKEKREQLYFQVRERTRPMKTATGITFTIADDYFLKNNRNKLTYQQMAVILGRSKKAIGKRLMKLNMWQPLSE